MKQKTVEVKLKQGLEARPAAMLVQVASKHASNIYLESEGRKVNAKSIMGMMPCACTRRKGNRDCRRNG